MKLSGCIFGAPMVVLAIVLIIFGVLWIMASTSPEAGGQAGGRLGVGVCLNVLGLLLIAGAGVLMYRSYKRYQAEKPQTIVQQIDLTGDLSLERLKCQSCGATLAKDNIDVKAGAVVVTCPYCGTSYEIEEEPKW
ncbi:MAG TPA: hypothetical protein VMW93_04915 [bacterium]|nr:hypothetical protein [bacterium]